MRIHLPESNFQPTCPPYPPCSQYFQDSYSVPPVHNRKPSILEMMSMHESKQQSPSIFFWPRGSTHKQRLLHQHTAHPLIQRSSREILLFSGWWYPSSPFFLKESPKPGEKEFLTKGGLLRSSKRVLPILYSLIPGTRREGNLIAHIVKGTKWSRADQTLIGTFSQNLWGDLLVIFWEYL